MRLWSSNNFDALKTQRWGILGGTNFEGHFKWNVLFQQVIPLTH
jgi:hypothetical protein